VVRWISTITSLRFAERQGAIDPGDVAVDVTAGTKIFSFAASGITANSDAGMLYVTNDGKVIAYDAVAAISEA